MRKFTIEGFFIDIDRTITDGNQEKSHPEEKLVWNNPIFGIIRDVMVEEGWESLGAKRKIGEYADKVIWWDCPDFIGEFRLPFLKT